MNVIIIMSSLLDDVTELLRLRYGEAVRLEYIKQTLVQNKMLYVVDREYLTKLSKRHLELNVSKLTTFSTFNSYKQHDETTVDKISHTISNVCMNCGNQLNPDVKFCINCGNPKFSANSIQSTPHVSNVAHYQLPSKPAGKIWYLLPIFLGLVGGIIGWAVIKKRNSKRAKNILILGIILGVIQYSYAALGMMSIFLAYL